MLLLLFLLRRCKLLHGLGAEVVSLGETMLVHLAAVLGDQHLGDGAVVAGEDSPQDAEHALLAATPAGRHLPGLDVLQQLAVHCGARAQAAQLLPPLVGVGGPAPRAARIGVGVSAAAAVLLQLLQTVEAGEGVSPRVLSVSE